MSTNTNLNDFLINADIVFDTTKIGGITVSSKYIAKTKIGKTQGGSAEEKKSQKLPDGIYWIDSSKKLLYLVNGQEATVPSTIQDNVLNLKNEKVQAFSPLKVVNSLSCLRGKGWIESDARPIDLNSSCPSKDDEQFFNFEIKQFNNGVEIEPGWGATKFIINDATGTSYRGQNFKSFILYANIIQDGKIELADMYAKDKDGSTTRLFVNGFKVLEFKTSYITKLANSKDYDRYKDKKNPFLLRNKNKMYTANENKFYFPKSMNKAATGFEYVIGEATQSRYYCTFSEESEDKFEILFLENDSQKIRSALVSHFNAKEMYNHELWHNDVVYSTIEKSNNPYFLKNYNWRTVAFTPYSEEFFSEIANQVLPSNSKIFEDIHKRYFTVSDDYTSDKFIEYPLKDFVYYCEDNLPALSTGPKEGDTALFGQKDDSKGLRYKDIFENSSNPYSSHKNDINSGKMTLPSRILPNYEDTNFYSNTEKKIIHYNIRRSSTPSLHFSYPQVNVDRLVNAGFFDIAPSKKLRLASGRYLCGGYAGGARGSCIWSEGAHGDYAPEIKPSKSFLAGSDSIPTLMFALLRAQSENRDISNYTNASTSGTYTNHKNDVYNKADIYQVTAPALAGSGLTSSIAADPFIFSQFNASINFWSFNATPVQMPDGLFYSSDPYTSIGLDTKSIYLYKDFLKTVCPNLLLVNLLDTQYFAKPSTGPFTNGLFLNGKRVSRKSFFSSQPSSIANDIPMLSVDTYSIKTTPSFAYSYRAFFVYDDEGKANLAHDLVAWNGYFSHGLRVHKPMSKNIYIELEKIMESSNSLGEVKTKIKELQTATKLDRLAISSSSDSITPLGRFPPSNASQYINIELNDWEMSKTTLAEFKNGAPQDPVEKAKVIDSAIVNKDKPSDVVVANKDGVLVSGVSIKGHLINGKLIDLKSKKNIDLLKGNIFKINVVDYSDPDQKNRVEGLKNKFITYKLENGSLTASLADGDFCASPKASGLMEMGGRFSQGLRVGYNSPEDEYMEDDNSKIVYTILAGRAYPLNGILINDKGGPFWIDGRKEKPVEVMWNSFTKTQDAVDDQPAEYMLDSNMKFESVVGYNTTSGDLFMVTSKDGEITSLPVGIYSQFAEMGTMPNTETVLIKFTVYMDGNKKKYSGSSPSVVGTTSGKLPVVTLPTKIAGNKWLVSGSHSMMNFSLGGNSGLVGVVVELDKDGNGFVKYGSEIKIRALTTKGKEYLVKAQFADRDGFFKVKNPEGHGVYFVNGHPTPYKNDWSIRGPKSDLRLISLMNKNFLDEKGDGYLSLSFLEGIKYNFPKDDYEYLPSLEILKTNKRVGAPVASFAPNANVTSKGFSDNNKAQSNIVKNKWIKAFTLNKIFKENENVFMPDPQTYERTSRFVSAIDVILTVGKENTDEKGNIIYQKGTVESVKNNLNKIYLKVATETSDSTVPGVPTKRNELEKFSIIDLAKHEAGIIWDLLPSTSLGFPTIKQEMDRQRFVEIYYKNLIHFTFKNGKAVSVCILDKWKQYMSRYKPIGIQRRMENVGDQLDKEAARVLGTYQMQNPEIIKELLKTIIYTDTIYIDVNEVNESYLENIIPQEIRGTYAPVGNRTGSLNSKLTIDLFSPLGDDFESFLSTNLDANGNGYSDGIYWVKYVASPLDESGDGFWDNSFFQKGKPV